MPNKTPAPGAAKSAMPSNTDSAPADAEQPFPGNDPVQAHRAMISTMPVMIAQIATKVTRPSAVAAGCAKTQIPTPTRHAFQNQQPPALVHMMPAEGRQQCKHAVGQRIRPKKRHQHRHRRARRANAMTPKIIASAPRTASTHQFAAIRSRIVRFPLSPLLNTSVGYRRVTRTAKRVNVENDFVQTMIADRNPRSQTC